MRFIKKEHNIKKIVDNIFVVANQAKNDKHQDVVNATIGSLYDEDGSLATYKTVYDIYNALDNSKKAAYASAIAGNQDFRSGIIDFVLDKHININKTALATVGGTGAISLSFKLFNEANSTILIPEIAWNSYAVMAEEYNLKTETYDIYNLDDLLLKAEIIAKSQKKLFLLINSPCHNPCGHSYRYEQWQIIMDKLKDLAKEAEIILLNDVAYLDYSYDLNEAKAYFKLFNDISDNMLILIAYSLSKAFSAYGQRLGSIIIMHKDLDILNDIESVYEKAIRTTWSNANNPMMLTFAELINKHKEAYLKENRAFCELLKKRSELFIKEADEIDLKYYPYKEGFFVTIILDEEIKDAVYEKLRQKHIYAVPVFKGLRVAICSIPLNKLKGLASKIKMSISECDNKH